MVAKRRGRVTVERSRYEEYMNVAQHFFDAAKDSMELDYPTAAGVLIVHSAIAYADAVCIMLSGQRSSGENHEEAIEILDAVAADDQEKRTAMNQLRRIIEEKTRVSYLGELYSLDDIKDMWKRLERFREWALKILTR